MNIQEIAKTYADARKIRAQAKQLSNRSLAAKFECSEWMISRAINHQPCSLPDEDQKLIRQCALERKQLEMEAGPYTMVGICRRHKIGQEKLISALVEMGEWEGAQ